MKIFLYGTLTDPGGFGFCAGKPLRAQPIPATLRNYRRVLLRGTRYPTLRRARGHCVQGVIMRVNADMLVRLQNYESASLSAHQIPGSHPARSTTRDLLHG